MGNYGKKAWCIMSADNLYSDDWNSCLTGSQMNAWNLEDDINRIGSRADDFLSGVWSPERCSSDKKSRWNNRSDPDSSDPFRDFQTPPPGRTSPTPLADLYSLSISQAEASSDSWQVPQSENDMEPTFEENRELSNVNNVEFMPQDMFSFSQQAAPSHEALNRSATAQGNNSPVETANISSAENNSVDNTPTLIVDTPQGEAVSPAKRPLLSLSVGMSICGVGLVFGGHIMHNAAVINPGKSLIIAGLIGLFVSVVFQSFNWFGKRKTA